MSTTVSVTATCDVCGKTADVVFPLDNFFVSTPSLPDGWVRFGHEKDVCSRACAKPLVRASERERLDRLFAKGQPA